MSAKGIQNVAGQQAQQGSAARRAARAYCWPPPPAACCCCSGCFLPPLPPDTVSVKLHSRLRSLRCAPTSATEPSVRGQRYSSAGWPRCVIALTCGAAENAWSGFDRLFSCAQPLSCAWHAVAWHVACVRTPGAHLLAATCQASSKAALMHSSPAASPRPSSTPQMTCIVTCISF